MAINLTSKKILIAEAHANLRETIKHIFGSLGTRFIVEAESGVDAIAAMKKDKFNIVLCDYDLLGKKTGQQVLDEAKHLKLLPVNSIFMIATDEHRLGLAPNAVDNKPDDYLIKPFSLKQVSSLLEKCDNRKRFLAGIENEIDSGNLFQAIRNCEKMLELDNKSMHLQLLKMQAELSIKVGDFKTAAKVYQDILDKRELPWARLGLGVVAYCLADYDNAVNTFQGLIKQYPAMLEAYDWQVKAYEAMGNDRLALSSINAAVTLAPQSILRQKKLAMLADKTDNIDLAQKAYTAIIELGKNSIHRSFSDYSGLANTYLKSNAADKALEIAVKMAQQFKADPEAKLRAALLEIEIYREKGNERLVERAYNKICELNGQLNKQLPRELRLNMAKIFCLNDNREACDEILNDLVKTYVDDKLFMKEIVALCNELIGENYVETLVESLTQELVDFNKEAAKLFKKGDIRGARGVFEQIAAKRPNNPKVILNLIKIILHDIKTSGASPEKIISTQSYINTAIQLGIAHDQISVLQTALDTFKNEIEQ